MDVIEGIKPKVQEAFAERWKQPGTFNTRNQFVEFTIEARRRAKGDNAEAMEAAAWSIVNEMGLEPNCDIIYRGEFFVFEPRL